MFIVFASLSSISWLKTFFFSPFQSPVIGQSVISISAFSKIKNIFRSTSSENDSKIPEEVTDLTVEPIINSILSLDYLVSSLYFIIMNFRCTSFPVWVQFKTQVEVLFKAWALSWYIWTFSENENEDYYVSLCMDIFGHWDS